MRIRFSERKYCEDEDEDKEDDDEHGEDHAEEEDDKEEEKIIKIWEFGRP